MGDCKDRDRLNAKTLLSHAVAVENGAEDASLYDMEENMLEKVQCVQIAKLKSPFKAPQGSRHQLTRDLHAPNDEVCKLWKDLVRRKKRSLDAHLGARNTFRESLGGVE